MAEARLTHTLTTRIRVLVVTLLLAAAAIVSVPQPAHGATSTDVANEAEWVAAIASLSSTSGGPHTVNITKDFTITDTPSSAIYSGDQDLIINGHGHTIDHDTLTANTEALQITGAGSVTMENATFTGFVGSPAVWAKSTATGKLTLKDSTFSHNSIDYDGGAIYSETAGGVDVYNCTFLDNHATAGYDAGAIFAIGGDIYIENSTFKDNTSDNNFGAIQGSQDIKVVGSTFRNNSATNNGGAVGASNTVTVSDSKFVSNHAGANGGAIYGGYAVEIDGSTLSDNSAGQDGGAVWSDTYIDAGLNGPNEFSDNTAGASGGALHGGTTVSIQDTTFTGNKATGGAPSFGGAAYSDDTLTTTNSTFTSNQSDDGGGAIKAVHVTTTGSTFTNNKTTSNAINGDGGAVYSTNSGSFTTSQFSNNSAAAIGGAVTVQNPGSTTTVQRSAFDHNTATLGGALNNGYNSLTVQNSTFYLNTSTAGYGGGIWTGEDLDSMFNTFVDNAATYQGAQAYSDDSDITSTATIWYESSATVNDCYADGSIVSNGHNYDNDGTCTDSYAGTGDVGDGAGEGTPGLSSYGDIVGPTKGFVPTLDGTVIGAIGLSACGTLATGLYDQRFVDRYYVTTLYPYGPTGCDIGAVEATETSSTTISGDTGTTKLTSVSGSIGCEEWTSSASYTPAPPADVVFPHGVFTFCVDVFGPGASVDITIEVPSAVNSLWKDNGGTWSKVPGVTIKGNKLTYRITDGGPLDQDGTANGSIVDPAAPGIILSLTG